MSRAAIKLALRAAMMREPFAAELDCFCRALLEACPDGRVYVSAKPYRLSMQNELIVKLLAEGRTISEVVRTTGASRDAVRWVGRKTGLKPPRR